MFAFFRKCMSSNTATNASSDSVNNHGSTAVEAYVSLTKAYVNLTQKQEAFNDMAKILQPQPQLSQKPEDVFRTFMVLMGMNPEDEHFADTPRRFVKYMEEFLQPFNAEETLKTGFGSPKEYHGMVVQTNIPFRGLCAHHLAPYLGTASIGYVPGERVIGLSKLGRLVKGIGLMRPSIQEQQTDEIADTLWDVLRPKGVIVVIQAEHTCMAARGLAAPNVPTITSSLRGVFRDVPQARQEFFDLIKSHS